MEPKPKSAAERLAELRAKGIRRVKPPAPVVPRPMLVSVEGHPPVLTEEELIRRQKVLHEWWEWNRAEQARRSADPSPEQRLTDWIWGKGR
jgi:hypothetical protein